MKIIRLSECFYSRKVFGLKCLLVLAVLLSCITLLTGFKQINIPSAGFLSAAMKGTSSPDEVKYKRQAENPVILKNAFRADDKCMNMYVAGQVIGENGQPVKGLTIHLQGVGNDGITPIETVTGRATEYGAGGYEIPIPLSQLVSDSKVWIQVQNQDGVALSDEESLELQIDCEKNLTVFNFVNLRASPGNLPSPTIETLASSTRVEMKVTPTVTGIRTENHTPVETGEIPTNVSSRKTLTPVPIENHPLYELQPGSPTYEQNFAHPDLGCQWIGVGGQIFDPEKRSVGDLIIEVGGEYQGKTISTLGITGSARYYGPGGFELMISDTPATTIQSLYLLVYDLQGNKLTDKIYFDTYSDCTKNLVLINLLQNAPQVTSTVRITQTQSPQVTSSLNPTADVTITPTVTEKPTRNTSWYGLKDGSPIYQKDTRHLQEGCAWLGIYGQVLDKHGSPLFDIVLEARGSLENYPVYVLGLTGANPEYGKGAYELHLADWPIQSHDSVWIQIKDRLGNPLSKAIFFDTYNDCNKNSIQMDFVPEQ